MSFVFLVFFASAASYMPAHAEPTIVYPGATSIAKANAVSTGYNAVANANAVSTGTGATANAFSYASNGNGGVRDCTYNRCTPTCSVPSPTNCPQDSNPCNCPEGTIISQEGGQCVQRQQCQRYINCKGDYNAEHTDCPDQCPATCANANVRNCSNNGCIPGCQCKSGYILSAINGKCIKPEQCPGGYPCGRNQTFINCLVECPDLYCPVDSSRVACGPTQICSSACGCKNKYLRKSVNDYTCILETDCPPGKCYGVNEEWNQCVALCFSDKCEDRKNPFPADCPFSPKECYPGCICQKGFYRKKGTCVPVQECPSDSQ